MKKETNNEIDLLLRRLSRRQGVPVSDVDEDHLDADELNSYAENALPAAARERYTEHLAECSRCRELVVQLSGSVPVVAAKETTTISAPSVFRKFLANLFSPMALRYAVPVSGLIIAATIGFIVLRSSNKEARYVAQLEPAATQPAPAISQTPDAQTFGFDGSAGRIAPKESAGKPATGGEKQEDAKTTSPVHAEPPAPATRSDREQQADEPTAINSAKQVASASPAPPSAPKPAETTDDMRVEVEGRKPQTRGVASNEVARARNYEAAKDEEKTKLAEEQQKKDALQPKAQTKSGTQTSGGAFSVAEADRDKAGGGGGVMRSVGGRRFRKQDGMWVDTAYDSGSAIVNVARGSEQYRALIADEPTIKTIAEQLEGTIVVVWKSRTYRIR